MLGLASDIYNGRVPGWLMNKIVVVNRSGAKQLQLH
jgi:hypothetical protein